ncbi:MAG: hypothetical protein CM1200mP18_04250 [Gammaproteobacteria bacterium]|nr:MAG: hypothetical protein CM1200mP18_04250 [Gammaproteobacteria bacterium]
MNFAKCGSIGHRGVDVNRYACQATHGLFTSPTLKAITLSFMSTHPGMSTTLGDDFKLDESNDEIMRKTEALCRKDADS